MPEMTTKPTEHFALNKAAPMVASYTPPPAPFEPAGPWRHRYRMYSMGYGQIRPEGELAVRRETGPRGRFVLEFLCRRDAKSGFSHFVEARLDCAVDALATPGSWTFGARMAREAGDPAYMDSGLSQQARVEAGTLRLEGDGHRRALPVSGPYTCKWCLLEAVHRLPRGEFDPIRFTLLDEFDQPHPDQELRFRKRARVQLADGPHDLVAYEHVGTGVLPTVFWVDEAGRCLFVMSCLEIYTLKEADGAVLDYDENRLMNFQRREGAANA